MIPMTTSNKLQSEFMVPVSMGNLLMVGTLPE